MNESTLELYLKSLFMARPDLMTQLINIILPYLYIKLTIISQSTSQFIHPDPGTILKLYPFRYTLRILEG